MHISTLLADPAAWAAVYAGYALFVTVIAVRPSQPAAPGRR
jgi:hypothetical protein